MSQENHSTPKSNSSSSSTEVEKKIDSKSAQPTKKAKQKCPHCGFTANKPSALSCLICEESLTAEPGLQLVPRSTIQSTSQASDKKSHRRTKGRAFLYVGAVVILASSIFMVFALNDGTETRFGGRLCPQRIFQIKGCE